MERIAQFDTMINQYYYFGKIHMSLEGFRI